MLSLTSTRLRSGRATIATLAAAAALLGLAATAHADSVTLNSRDAGTTGYTQVDSTSGVVASGKRIVAEVTGTMSYWSKAAMLGQDINWPTVCGTFAAGPIFNSQGYASSNQGRVGLDPEFIFARPWASVSCNRRPWPIRWANFELSTTSGTTGFGHPTTLGPVTTIRSDHKYSYPLVGTGTRIYFRLKETGPVSDNYGELHVTTRNAADADCVGNGYILLQYASVAACQTAL